MRELSDAELEAVAAGKAAAGIVGAAAGVLTLAATVRRNRREATMIVAK